MMVDNLKLIVGASIWTWVHKPAYLSILSTKSHERSKESLKIAANSIFGETRSQIQSTHSKICLRVDKSNWNQTETTWEGREKKKIWVERELNDGRSIFDEFCLRAIKSSHSLLIHQFQVRRKNHAMMMAQGPIERFNWRFPRWESKWETGSGLGWGGKSGESHSANFLWNWWGERKEGVNNASLVPVRVLVFTWCETARDRHRPGKTKVSGPAGLGPTYASARFLAA